MKKLLVLLLCALMLLGGCSGRTAPVTQTPDEPVNEESSRNENEEEPVNQDTEKEESDTQPPVKEDAEEEKEEEKSQEEINAEKEASDDNGGESASGLFRLLNSGYEIALDVPFMAVYDSASDGLYISVLADSGVQGIVSYTDDADQVAAIEQNITALNETLKNDESVKDFEFDREKDEAGLYSIIFTYRTEEDEVSSRGYNYVLYRQTAEGMITVMFSCDSNKYDTPISTVFRSVQPATAEAVDPPSR